MVVTGVVALFFLLCAIAFVAILALIIASVVRSRRVRTDAEAHGGGSADEPAAAQARALDEG